TATTGPAGATGALGSSARSPTALTTAALTTVLTTAALAGAAPAAAVRPGLTHRGRRCDIRTGQHALPRCQLAQQRVGGVDLRRGGADPGATGEVADVAGLVIGHQGDDRA